MNITRGYKVSTDDKKDDIDKRTGMLAQKLKIEIKMEQHTSTPASVTLRDHKNKFSTNKHCRLINQAKSKLGIVSNIGKTHQTDTSRVQTQDTTSGEAHPGRPILVQRLTTLAQATFSKV